MPHTQKSTDIPRSINHILELFLPVIVPMSIVLGFLLPSVFINLRPYIPWLFGIMTFSGALKLTAGQLGAAVRSPLPILLFFVSAHILMPVVAMLASSLFIKNPDVVSGFVLLFAGPTAVTGFIWASIFKGDMALCLTLILLDTLLAPVVVPLSISILMGAKVTMNMSGIAISLLFMIVIPTIAGVTINEASRRKAPEIICPYLDPAAKLCMLSVIATNASIIAPGINFANPIIWKTAVLTFVLTITGFLVIKFTTVLGKCRYPKDITMIIAGGLRNNSAVMTIAVAFFPEAAVLPTLLSVMLQQSIAAIMGKLFLRKRGTANH
ncbi:MAG: hypothetical protein FWG99_01545 [Treponema sp.]|nr:hypothetical protein [Treponema sp.]